LGLNGLDAALESAERAVPQADENQEHTAGEADEA
jgi:hypothetical protein